MCPDRRTESREQVSDMPSREACHPATGTGRCMSLYDVASVMRVSWEVWIKSTNLIDIIKSIHGNLH